MISPILLAFAFVYVVIGTCCQSTTTTPSVVYKEGYEYLEKIINDCANEKSQEMI